MENAVIIVTLYIYIYIYRIFYQRKKFIYPTTHIMSTELLDSLERERERDII